MSLAACRSCGAPLVWALTTSGKRMPLDANPVPEGTMVLRPVEGQREPQAVHALGAEHELRYRPHFVTCPHASEWRRR